MKSKILILMLGVLLSAAGLAMAEPIAIAITGQITYLNVGSEFTDIHVGDSFTGLYTYNSTTLDSDPSPIFGTYQQNSPYGISLILDGYEFKTDPSQMSGQFSVSISNDYHINLNQCDRYSINSYQNMPVNGLQVSCIGWELNDRTHSVFSSDALPITAPILNQWNSNEIGIAVLSSSGGQYYILGTVTQAVLIPEPLTSLLMVTGVFLLRRKR